MTICERYLEVWTSVKAAAYTIAAQWVVLAVLMNAVAP